MLVSTFFIRWMSDKQQDILTKLSHRRGQAPSTLEHWRRDGERCLESMSRVIGSGLCVIICGVCVFRIGFVFVYGRKWLEHMLVPVFVCRGVMLEHVLICMWYSLSTCDGSSLCMFPVCVSLTVYLLYVCVICFNWSVKLTSQSSAGAEDVKFGSVQKGERRGGEIMRTYICVIWLRGSEKRR